MLARAIPEPYRPKRVRIAGVASAAFLVIMVVAQLFSYESFTIALSSVLAFNDSRHLQIAASIVVIAETFAIPYLLGMSLSPLMRAISALLGVAVSVTWFFVSLTSGKASNSALFGDTLVVPGGVYAVLLSTFVLASVLYVVSWSMRESKYHSLRK